MDDHGVIELLKKETTKVGSQRRLAQIIGVGETFMSDVIGGRRPASDRILAYLGLARETTIVARKS